MPGRAVSGSAIISSRLTALARVHAQRDALVGRAARYLVADRPHDHRGAVARRQDHRPDDVVPMLAEADVEGRNGRTPLQNVRRKPPLTAWIS